MQHAQSTCYKYTGDIIKRFNAKADWNSFYNRNANLLLTVCDNNPELSIALGAALVYLAKAEA